MKRVLSAVLALVLLVGMIPYGVVGADEMKEGYYTYVINNGKATIIDIDESISGDVVIPDTLGGYSVGVIGRESFTNCVGITSITFPDSVWSIECYAFKGCNKLTKVMLGDGISSVSYFASLNNVKEIYIDNLLTWFNIGYTLDEYFDIWNHQMGDYSAWGGYRLYVNGKELTELIIPDGIKRIGGSAFSRCVSLKNVTISSSVKEIGMLAFCDTNIQNLTICEGVTTIGTNAFRGCNIEKLTIPKTVTSIEDCAFSWCRNLQKVDIIGSATYICSDSFKYCARLKDIAISANNTVYKSVDGALLSKDGTTLIQYFRGNDRTHYKIPEGVTTINTYAFAGCNLKSITIPYSVKHIHDGAFEDCSELTDVFYSGNEEEWSYVNINYIGGDRWGFTACNTDLLDANFHFLASPNSSIAGSSANRLYLEDNLVVLDIGDNKDMTVHACNTVFENGEIVNSDDRIIRPELLNWSFNSELISVDSNGKIPALGEGYAFLSVCSKEDIRLSTFCHVYIGNTNELSFTSTYDTKQYHAGGSFYSETSSISDCVEIYVSAENKLTDDIKDISGIDEAIKKDTEKKKFKAKMNYANKLAIPFVVLLGEDEITAGMVSVKDMVSGEQRTLPVGEAAFIMKAAVDNKNAKPIIQE